MSKHVTNVTKENFEAEVIKSDKPVLIDFWADWCGPCKAFGPTFEKFAEDNKDRVKCVKINVDENPELASGFGIQSIPTIYLIKNGELLGAAKGNMPASMLNQFVNHSLGVTGGGGPSADVKSAPKGPKP